MDQSTSELLNDLLAKVQALAEEITDALAEESVSSASSLSSASSSASSSSSDSSSTSSATSSSSSGTKPQPPPPGTIPKTEMEAIALLIPEDQVTHEAVKSGNFSDPAVWSAGTVPGAGSRWCVPQGISVLWDMDIDAHWACLEGSLVAVNDRNLKMAIDYLVVMDGHIELVTERKLTVTFRGDGPVSDPMKLGRGLICTPDATGLIAGIESTPWTYIADASKGDTTITVLSPVNLWSVGDQLALNGMQGRGGDDTTTVAAINGNTITLSAPLAYDHKAKMIRGKKILPAVGNFTSNITFQSYSDDTPIAERGHLMFMGAGVARGNYASRFLGRTDKRYPVTDYDPSNLAAHTNPRGRYADHSHKNGVDNQAAIYGARVWKPTGWGIVNHSSNVSAKNCCVYGAFGAGLIGEVGDEHGEFSDCFVVNVDGMPGFGDIQDHNNPANNDTGFSGVGIWLEGGGGIKLYRNYIAGQLASPILINGRADVCVDVTKMPFAWPFDPSLGWYGAGVVVTTADGVHLVKAMHAFCTVVDNVSVSAGAKGEGLGLWNLHNEEAPFNSSMLDYYNVVSGNVMAGAVFDGYCCMVKWDGNNFESFGHSGVNPDNAFDRNSIGELQAPSDGINALTNNTIDVFDIQNVVNKLRRLTLTGNTIKTTNMIRNYVWWDEAKAIDGSAGEGFAMQQFNDRKPVFGDDIITIDGEFLFWPQCHRSYSFANYLGLQPKYRLTNGELQDQFQMYCGQLEIPSDAHQIQGCNGWLSKNPSTDKS